MRNSQILNPSDGMQSAISAQRRDGGVHLRKVQFKKIFLNSPFCPLNFTQYLAHFLSGKK